MALVYEFINPLPPTSHPWFSSDRHPLINTFSVLPVTNASNLEPGAILQFNLATYTDPYAESDFHRQVSSKPRWMQGLLVEIDEIRNVDGLLGNPCDLPAGMYPADRAFTGRVRSHDADAQIEGVLHPQLNGWLAFEGDAFGGRSLKTVADLKAYIGKITPEAALRLNEQKQRVGTFTLSNGLSLS